jgi:Ca2+-binding RTX toxin-like protein
LDIIIEGPEIDEPTPLSHGISYVKYFLSDGTTIKIEWEGDIKDSSDPTKFIEEIENETGLTVESYYIKAGTGIYDHNGEYVGEFIAHGDEADPLSNSADEEYPYDNFTAGDTYDFTGEETTYTYTLTINEAALSDPNETLGDIVVTGLPVGAILSNEDGTEYVLSDEPFTFSSSSDFPQTWTLTTDSELGDDASIVASLTSNEGDSTATTYVGLYGDNDIVGGSDNDMIYGGSGDDMLHGGSGEDHLYGEEGDDLLHFDTEDIVIDGGEGMDTLIVAGPSAIDFTALSNVSNIEVIDLTDSMGSTLTNVTALDIMEMTDTNNNIYIIGDAADQFDFADNAAWNQTGTALSVDINGNTYQFNQYTSAEDPTVVVHVETELEVL